MMHSTIFGGLQYVDFETSMNLAAYPQLLQQDQTSQRLGIPGVQVLNFFKSLYERHNFLKIKPQHESRIPKIIHQIWIGDAVPQKFKQFQESWLKLHPDWEYRLWTSHDLPLFAWHNADLLSKSRNPGEISDIMRYEILYTYGGVYIDFDFECLQALDELNRLYDFYIGIQPLDCELVQLGIGLIGSVAGHPILKAAIENLHAAWHEAANQGNAPAKTGPLYFTKIFLNTAGNAEYCDVALPAHYFYPLACTQEELLYDMWIEQGAFGVHHWAKSWLLPSFRKKKFQELKVQDLPE